MLPSKQHKLPHTREREYSSVHVCVSVALTRQRRQDQALTVIALSDAGRTTTATRTEPNRPEATPERRDTQHRQTRSRCLPNETTMKVHGDLTARLGSARPSNLETMLCYNQNDRKSFRLSSKQIHRQESKYTEEFSRTSKRSHIDTHHMLVINDRSDF